ncbi:MAG: hypothetical protein LBE33_10895 [Zoogloeaceae bacterium]|jgi:uncharacterized protein YcfJ|nr:hypothetical protein [Zoogloeaceae bacterium]
MQKGNKLALAAMTVLTAACVTLPEGPSVMVLPGSNMSFDQFRQDDAVCRQYAAEQIGQSANAAAGQSAVTSAAVGATIGAVAGAAIGGSRGAGVGAGTGLMMGGLSGAGASQASGYEAQRRYDNAFVQCMYAKGHRVPVTARYSTDRPASAASMPPPPAPGPASAPTMPNAASYPPPPPPPAPPPPSSSPASP